MQSQMKGKICNHKWYNKIWNHKWCNQICNHRCIDKIITNDVINKTINNNFVFPNMPAQLTLDDTCLFLLYLIEKCENQRSNAHQQNNLPIECFFGHLIGVPIIIDKKKINHTLTKYSHLVQIPDLLLEIVNSANYLVWKSRGYLTQTHLTMAMEKWEVWNM